ncbi:theronine dehydrogenase-like Zn-dependent dehydrogenase [Opitutaceae bacterium TAV5]|nr:theronine dehydrogenase-like Zn-dependent dehydrogenase [Opitutaceae bacterium TAV5]
MKGYRITFPAPRTAKLETFDLPENCPSGHVLLETEYTLISPGTEMDMFHGRANTTGNFPKRPGYSAAGKILATGDGVTELKPGDRVIAYHSNHATLSIKEQRHVVRIEDPALDSKTAVFAIIAAMGLQGVRKLRLELGESAMIMGLGLLGLFATQCARLSGAMPIIALDYSEARRALALQLGADHVFSPDEKNLPATIKTLTGGGVNAVAEITGSPLAVKQALACTAPMGRVSLTGCSRTPTLDIDFYNDVHKPGITLIGAHNFVRPSENSRPGYWTLRDDLKMLLRFFAAGRLHAAPLIAEVVVPQKAPEIYQRLAAGGTNPPGILFDWRNAIA